eukprot:TRINITY_DN26704_c2_g1_i1.p1 TRINITY_DN26704_c2_g1~~TRINITY_DN26704_c2_g1_i1.p1  ORF type:complete len:291 (+),score=38.88 TRINITY_DN26704_c2_g1_i1:215-1087(+)
MTGSPLNTIMVPVRGDGMGENVLEHASVLAKRFGSRVRVVHCHPKADDLMPFGVVIPQVLRRSIEEAAERNVEVTKDQLVAEFRALAQKFGLEERDHQEGHPTTRFIEYEGKQVDAVRHFGRLSDLLCVAQPDKDSGLGVNTLKAALFSSGRPVLMCPNGGPVSDSYADHIAVAWNGSLEASRSVALSLPLLLGAEKVTILATGSTEHAATPEELQRYFELKGIASDIHLFKPTSGIVGKDLLDQSMTVGAGALLMGAYHDSYERESMFGGNSQVVVDTAQIPVIMAHQD